MAGVIATPVVEKDLLEVGLVGMRKEHHHCYNHHPLRTLGGVLRVVSRKTMEHGTDAAKHGSCPMQYH